MTSARHQLWLLLFLVTLVNQVCSAVFTGPCKWCHQNVENAVFGKSVRWTPGTYCRADPPFCLLLAAFLNAPTGIQHTCLSLAHIIIVASTILSFLNCLKPLGSRQSPFPHPHLPVNISILAMPRGQSSHGLSREEHRSELHVDSGLSCLYESELPRPSPGQTFTRL